MLDDKEKMTWHLAGKTVGSTEEKVLYRHGSEVDRNSFPMGLSLSPDENYLAFTRGYTEEGKRIRGIVFLSVSDGTMRRVFADPEAISLFYAWSADSKSILFTRGAQNSQSKRQVWQVALDGSPPRRIGIEMEGLIGIAARPDGKRIAYTASSRGTELWVLENFLPPAKSPGK